MDKLVVSDVKAHVRYSASAACLEEQKVALLQILSADGLSTRCLGGRLMRQLNPVLGIHMLSEPGAIESVPSGTRRGHSERRDMTTPSK